MTTDTPAFDAPRHIDLVATAKLIRRHLTSTFPGQKFSVRTERFSMGTAVDVSWIDGPTVAQVEAITDPFASSGFDGSVDSGYVVSSWYCAEHGASIRHTTGTEGQRGYVSSIDDVSCCLGAEPVVFGTKFVSAARILSDDFRALLMNDLEVALGDDVEPGLCLWAAITADGRIVRSDSGERVTTLVHQLAASTSVTPEREIVRVVS